MSANYNYSDGQRPFTPQWTLGVRRTNVSVVAKSLQSSGLIKYRRGTIEIVGIHGLRKASCESYVTVKRHYNRLLNNSIIFVLCREPDIDLACFSHCEIGLKEVDQSATAPHA